MEEVFLVFLLEFLFKNHWLPVVTDRDFIAMFNGHSRFNPYRLTKDPSGDLKIDMEGEYEEGTCEPKLVETSEECFHYILQLMSYVYEYEMTIEEFCGKQNDWRLREIIDGILFEYFLLLITRYFELIAAEESDYQDLFLLSEDDEEIFEEKKKLGQILLGLLKLTSTKFRTNPHILPKLHYLIDSFMSQFPDTIYLVVLADFSERGFLSLYINEENSYTGMCSCMNHESFRNERIFQNLDGFKHFRLLSFLKPARLCSTFVCLLKNYCAPHYNKTESKKAIVNACAFLMTTMPNEAAFEAINQIFTELEKPTEMVPFILETIFVIKSEHLRGIVESSEFPIHHVESLKRLADNFTDALTRKYDFWRDELKKLYDKKDLVAALTAISKKSFVAGLIFERIFYRSLFDSKRKFEDIFDASICGSIQSVIEHSKILSECKGVPEELQEHRRFLIRKFPEGILMSSGCGSKTTISAALEHLRKSRQKIHEARQAEWRERGVASQRWDSRFYDNSDSVKLFPKYERLTVELNQIDTLISELQKHSGSKLLKDVQDENTKEIERVNAQIKVFDDQKQRIRVEHERLIKEVKKSILDSLFGGQE
jgi:hypothetical protein